MSLFPPYDASTQKIMDQWLQRQREPSSDRELLELAAWLDARLDGQLDEQQAARVELLLASDKDLLHGVLALQNITTEPVPACDLLAAQALVADRVAQPSMVKQIAKLFAWPRNWQPVPMAAAALFSVLVVTGSLWMGRIVAAELGVEDMQIASQQQITQLDFGGLDSVASATE